MPFGLVLAIIISAVLHAGFLLLGHRLVFTVEGGGGVQAKVFTASLKGVTTLELVSDSAREKPSSDLAVPHPALVEQDNKSPVISDRALPEEEIAPEAGATEHEPEVSQSFGARYFKGSELTQRPQPIESIELSYPALGLLQDIERSGSIVLRLLIAETGAVDQVLVESSNLPAAFQDETVVRFTHARFAPGQIDGVQVKSQMRIEVTFSSGA